ncbi:MAG: nucleotide sugar dehydrogenase, partial [Porticoccaceae bacterium]|nr:nucleotide sugar dehydrogenase [Porticoccaceae bacterium]
HERLMVMDLRSAELTKYAANAMLATKISFINEIANIAENLGADVESVRQGIGADPRIGYHFIYPGCGYGGSCFPKDVRALEASAVNSGYVSQLLKAVDQVNERQKRRLFEKIYHYFNGDLAGKTFALWGLAFKPNTDDVREAPSRQLMAQLWRSGARVRAYDPHAMDAIQDIYGCRDDLVLTGTKEAAVSGADALIVCTEWKAFWAPDFAALRQQLKNPVIFDGRNLYDPARIQEQGFDYFGVGRSAVGANVASIARVA